MTVWPTDQPQPVVSTLNVPTGVNTANAALIPAGTGGDASVYATDDTNLLIDINGYFAAPASGSLALYPLTPCRALDTRQTVGPFDGTLPVNILQSPCLVPASAQAYVLNATVVPQGAFGYLTLWADGQPMPVVSTLNASDGAVTSNMALVPTLNGSIDAFASNETNLILDISSYFAPITPQILTANLPAGVEGSFYTSTLQAAGGFPPYTWTLQQGSLPPGLSLSSNGTISGTPTRTGTSSFTVQVSDTQQQTATATSKYHYSERESALHYNLFSTRWNAGSTIQPSADSHRWSATLQLVNRERSFACRIKPEQQRHDLGYSYHAG